MGCLRTNEGQKIGKLSEHRSCSDKTKPKRGKLSEHGVLRTNEGQNMGKLSEHRSCLDKTKPKKRKAVRTWGAFGHARAKKKKAVRTQHVFGQSQEVSSLSCPNLTYVQTVLGVSMLFCPNSPCFSHSNFSSTSSINDSFPVPSYSSGIIR